MYCMYLGLYPGWYYCWVPHLHCCLCNKSDTQQWAVSNKTKKKKCKEGFIQSVGKLQTLICSAILPINLKQRESGPLDYFVGFFSIYLRKYCSQQAEAFLLCVGCGSGCYIRMQDNVQLYCCFSFQQLEPKLLSKIRFQKETFTCNIKSEPHNVTWIWHRVCLYGPEHPSSDNVSGMCICQVQNCGTIFIKVI